MGRSQVLYNRLSAKMRAERGGRESFDRNSQYRAQRLDEKKHSANAHATASSQGTNRNNQAATNTELVASGKRSAININKKEDDFTVIDGSLLQLSLLKTPESSLCGQKVDSLDMENQYFITDDQDCFSKDLLGKIAFEDGYENQRAFFSSFPNFMPVQTICSSMAQSLKAVPSVDQWRIPEHLVDSMYSSSEKRRQKLRLNDWNNRIEEKQRREMSTKLAKYKHQSCDKVDSTDQRTKDHSNVCFDTGQCKVEPQARQQSKEGFKEGSTGINVPLQFSSSSSSASVSVFLNSELDLTESTHRPNSTHQNFSESTLSQRERFAVTSNCDRVVQNAIAYETNRDRRLETITMATKFLHDSSQYAYRRHYEQPTVSWLAHEQGQLDAYRRAGGSTYRKSSTENLPPKVSSVNVKSNQRKQNTKGNDNIINASMDMENDMINAEEVDYVESSHAKSKRTDKTSNSARRTENYNKLSSNDAHHLLIELANNTTTAAPPSASIFGRIVHVDGEDVIHVEKLETELHQSQGFNDKEPFVEQKCTDSKAIATAVRNDIDIPAENQFPGLKPIGTEDSMDIWLDSALKTQDSSNNNFNESHDEMSTREKCDLDAWLDTVIS